MRLFLSVTIPRSVQVSGSIVHANDMELVFRVREMRRFLEAELDELYWTECVNDMDVYLNRTRRAAEFGLPDTEESILHILTRRLIQIYGPDGNGWLESREMQGTMSSFPVVELTIPEGDVPEEVRHLLN